MEMVINFNGEQVEVAELPNAENYAASADGRIFNVKLGKVRQTYVKNGYEYVDLSVNGVRKHYRVHRLIMLAWKPRTDAAKLEVNHIDENKLNNNLTNLEWCDAKYNSNYGTRNKRISRTIMQGKILAKCDVFTSKVICTYDTQREAAAAVGGRAQNISTAAKDFKRTAYGFRWKYIEEKEIV